MNTPTLEQAAQALLEMCDEIKPNWRHVETREIQLYGAHLDNQYAPPIFEDDDAYISIGRTRAQWHKFYAALDQLRAALETHADEMARRP